MAGLARPCPASVVPPVSVSSSAVACSFPCLSCRPCLPCVLLVGRYLPTPDHLHLSSTAQTRDGECRMMGLAMLAYSPHAPPLAALLRQVRKEYRDTPGLTLTKLQAMRLFGVAPSVCAAMLRALVMENFLSRAGDGLFVRSTTTGGHRIGPELPRPLP
jgi:hypothetical protein